MRDTHPIRIPPVTSEQRKAYLRAAGRRKLSLNEWIVETLDREAETKNPLIAHVPSSAASLISGKTAFTSNT